MFDLAEALALMQYGDSAYPAGGFAFSWGVEGLAADGLLAGADQLERVVVDQLQFRWAMMDRPLLGAAWRAGDVKALRAVDLEAEALTPVAEMREGSRRAGRALVGVAARRGGALASAYRGAFADSRLGHLPIAQAIAYRDASMSLASAEVVSGWSLVNGLVSAATRLGLVGHAQAQDLLAAGRRALADVLAQACAVEPSSFTPLADIAMARAATRVSRLFTT